MPAHVQQRIDLAFRIAHENHRLPGDLEQKEISALAYLAVVTDAQPRSQEDVRNLPFIELRIPIHVARQRVTGAPGAKIAVQHLIHSPCLSNRASITPPPADDGSK